MYSLPSNYLSSLCFKIFAAKLNVYIWITHHVTYCYPFIILLCIYYIPFNNRNYGWREREGPCKMGRRDSNDCDLVDPSKYQDPIHFYENNKNTGAAVVGGAFIPNGIWPSDYDNEFLYSDLRSNSLFHMKYEPDHECRGQNCTVQKSKYVPTP